MKAISKKYGKKPWIKTPLSRHYRRRIPMATIMALQAVALGQVGINHIRFTQGHRVEKILAMAEAGMATIKGVNRSLKWAKTPNE